MENIEVLKKDIQLIKNKISECVSNKFTDCFDIEMKIMTELPEQYNDYPWLIKRLSKSKSPTSFMSSQLVTMPYSIGYFRVISPRLACASYPTCEALCDESAETLRKRG